MLKKIILWSCLLSPMCGWSQSIPSRSYIIRAGKFYDSESNRFLLNQDILVKNDIIIEVGAKLSVPADTEVLDFSRHTVTPGLIDAHTHLLLNLPAVSEPDPTVIDPLIQSESQRILRGAYIAKTYLQAGFTTVRDVGNSGNFFDVTLRNAIQKGYVEGPRMFVSGPILSAVGGQYFGLSYHLNRLIAQEYRVIKSVDDARLAVKENLNYGADLIKICSDNSPNSFLLTVDEMKTIVETAHQYGKKVTAHATSDESMRNAVLAGVDGIEHGYGISDSTLTLMAQRKVYLVPTDVSYNEGIVRVKNKWGLTGKEAAEAVNRFILPNHKRIQQALTKGVLVVAGSDLYEGSSVGKGAKDVLVAYLEAGVGVANTLRFATYNAAQALGMSGTLGVLKKGAKADLTVFSGDLEQTFQKSLYDVMLVMKNGVVHYQSEGKPNTSAK